MSLNNQSHNHKSIQPGFTIVELLVVIVVIGILAAIVLNVVASAREKAYFAKAKTDLSAINKAIHVHELEYGSPPSDVSSGIPAPLVQGISGPKTITGGWYQAAWPGSFYDYEAWDLDSDGVVETYQISIRFCTKDDGSAYGSNCRFPKSDWAKNFQSESAVYWCTKGYCKSSLFQGWSYPGYCVNCPENKSVSIPSP